jgi:polyisoprenyl-teichoic acid--peptidoglycan teichoic acid transferase
MKERRQNRRSILHGLKESSLFIKILFVIVIISGMISAVLMFQQVRKLTQTWTITDFSDGGIPIFSTDTETNNGESNGDVAPDDPISSIPVVEDDFDWDGSSRITILLMGLDYRDWTAGEGPPRTDSMILLTYDPKTNIPGMLSVPRDLWVNIPGFGSGKINTAYQLGEGAKLPGGGPALAVRTLEEFLGISIPYYAQIDFQTFVDFIDLIGGVLVTPEQDVWLDIIDKDVKVFMKAGVREVLPGSFALAYARNRSTEGGDFDRAIRQQQIIVGLQRQLLMRDTRAKLLENAFEIWETFSQGIRTNITFSEALQLANTGIELDLNQFQRGAITVPDHVTLEYSPEGLNILKPITSKIRELRDYLFSDSSSGPITSGLDSATLMRAEAANIAIYNGTFVSGLAGLTQDFLVQHGVTISEVGNTDSVNSTKVIDYSGNPYTLQFLVEVLNVSPSRIFSSYNPDYEIDIEIIIGPEVQSIVTP